MYIYIYKHTRGGICLYMYIGYSINNVGGIFSNQTYPDFFITMWVYIYRVCCGVFFTNNHPPIYFKRHQGLFFIQIEWVLFT